MSTFWLAKPLLQVHQLMAGLVKDGLELEVLTQRPHCLVSPTGEGTSGTEEAREGRTLWDLHASTPSPHHSGTDA